MQSKKLTHIWESNGIAVFNLSAHWAQGNIVALVRHAERCDHSDNQCLDGDTGITIIGKDISLKIGSNFEDFLPTDHALIYNSPLKRTSQTAQFMFNGASISQAWLHDNCKARFLEDIIEHKKDGTNMILVTHSTCINGLRTLLNNKLIPIAAGADENYAVTIFLTISKADRKAYVLGYVDANDWENFSQDKTRVAGVTPSADPYLL